MLRKIAITTGLILLWAAAVAAVVFAEAFWFGRPPVERGNLASIENHLAEKLRGAVAGKKLGSAGLVLVRNGRIAAEHGFGVSDADTRAPVKTDETLFQLASVSKAVTAFGVMKLVEDGKIGLDEPVARRLKRWQFPGSEEHRRDKVTVRHLLSHTAGLEDGGGRLRGFFADEKLPSLEESLSPSGDSTAAGGPVPVRLVIEPGTRMVYGNGNYAVLQLLIEEVTGRPFAAYMKETVLVPLGMTKSSFDLDAVVAEGRERDLAPNFDAGLNEQPRRRYPASGAVALYSTPRDLARFALAFTGENPVLKPETMKQMSTPQAGTGGGWGLGQTLYAGNDAGGFVAGHDGGSLPAWGAVLRVNPATGNAMVLTVSGGSGAVNQLSHDWVYWETGKMTPAGRRQKIYDRIFPAAAAAILGAVVIALWKIFR